MVHRGVNKIVAVPLPMRKDKGLVDSMKMDTVRMAPRVIICISESLR